MLITFQWEIKLMNWAVKKGHGDTGLLSFLTSVREDRWQTTFVVRGGKEFSFSYLRGKGVK